ncbi:hypothetical protein P280DRAFT_474729 [Massarina eburnea CBS 473.64]|uniref:Uncharacterized protein n=1 Tax=Massarina eburnea CBS 473.64 TaxID=1395130 RepID=A0A6A6RJR5_9PLEO|nr:hypothetical protein P280DRAFT_474729 [Massarina eburnea CBS 473.64]
MQNPHGLRLVGLIAPPIFLLALSCLTFLLERISTSTLKSQVTRNFDTGTPEISLPILSNNTATTATQEIPISTNIAPTLANIGVAVFASCVGILGGCGIWELKKLEGSMRYQRMWAWMLLVWNAITIGLCVGVLGWASAVQGSEKGWSSAVDVGKGGDGVRLTRETWTCGVHRSFPGEGWAGSVCGLAKTIRFMLIPLAIAAALTMLATWILTRDRGGVKWLIGGKGRYEAFESVYEMNTSAPAQGPAPMHYGQPMPYPQPASSFPQRQQFQNTPPIQPQAVLPVEKTRSAFR